MSASDGGQTYAASGNFKTTGLAGVLRRIRFSAASKGKATQPIPRPMHYKGHIDTGRRVSETELRFTNGVPQKTNGAQDPAVPIAQHAKQGALDPMSMMWTTLRDQTAATLCQLDQTQFDGTRLVRLTLTARSAPANDPADSVTCSGTYDRIGGYSPQELAEMKVSPLSITYRRVGNIWQAQQVNMTTRHGKAQLHRQSPQQK